MPVAVERQPNAFIRQLPKAELHLHLEGAVTPATLLELRRRHSDATTLAETEALYRYSDFPSFLMAFKEVSAHLRGPDDYELAAYRLMQQLKDENVLHAEVYVAVGVCLFRKQDFAAIFEGLERGRARGARDFGVSLLWIFDATRHFGVEAAQNVFELAVHYRDRHVVGVGIGGDEQKAPPELFRGVYAYAEDHGLRLTAHAGETGPPESVWGALNLRAERIGHGYTAARDADLVEELAQRQIPVEICITSNVRTGVCKSVSEHPVRNFFDQGVMVTLNTDDPALFRTSLAREYQLAQDTFGFTDEHLRELARNSFEASFLPAEKKLELLGLFDAAAAR
ncbi:MAG TPA: adenosine deaminase [Candidatus Sulfotelmatobacter sp.]|jgi:adenosine deaminase/aminodeoxyfutalosine deaminase|nr:adenosine deaminase [Candidatus Sulfotelmatobacter sp.]